jgi:hypothetical protein
LIPGEPAPLFLSFFCLRQIEPLPAKVYENARSFFGGGFIFTQVRDLSLFAPTVGVKRKFPVKPRPALFYIKQALKQVPKKSSDIPYIEVNPQRPEKQKILHKSLPVLNLHIFCNNCRKFTSYGIKR